jgi:2-phospho-L-lactate guanylyltransferase
VLPDAPDAGLVQAVRHAAQTLADARCAGMLVVPADLPSIKSADIELIALGHRSSPAVTLVAAGSDGGTNALACSPPDALPICYGEDSFRRHYNAASSRGLVPRVLTLPRFELDIDRPEDLLSFMTQPATTRTHKWLRDSGIAQRLQALRAVSAAVRLTDELTCADASAFYQKG